MAALNVRRMNENTDQNIPVEALRFGAPAAFAAGEGDELRRVEGVAYSGEVVTDHWYWDAVVFDLTGVEQAGRLPLLVDHDPGKRVGFTELAVGGDIRLSNARLLKTAQGQQIAEEADQGFPWQMSVFIQPTRIERVQAGERVTINGREVVGPVTVFRASRVREVSFTPTGADHRTSAAVFNTGKGVKEMPDDNVVELNKQVAKLSADLAAANARADAAEGEVRAAKLSARTDKVKALFATMGREATPESMAPYVAMEESQFSAVSADLSAAAKAAAPAAPQPPAHLFGTTVPPAGNPGRDPLAIAAAASAFKAQRATAGVEISDAEAVAHVLKGA